jgi:formaldehyde-activating enzyme involved in methanogenesis
MAKREIKTMIKGGPKNNDKRGHYNNNKTGIKTAIKGALKQWRSGE